MFTARCSAESNCRCRRQKYCMNDINSIRSARKPSAPAPLLLGAAFVLCAITLNSRAEDDLPTRVGRVADYAGTLYLAPQDRVVEWDSIGINHPVIQGDSLSVRSQGRAEVDFGFAQMRLAGDTNVQVTVLEDHRFGSFLASGRLILRLRSLDPGESALVDSPHAHIQLDRPGLYRIEVDEQRQQTTLTVRAGEAEIRFAGGQQQTLPGQTATVIGGEASISLQVATGTDTFDAWSALRDRGYDASTSVTYVSPEMVGAADLDSYGSWENYAPYGNVWFPTTVAAGWAPYRFGTWAWVGPWGWTWVDDAPWGFAPFHYGRWVWFSGRWGWCPGPLVRHPRWAPALVAWYGGPGSSFSKNLGAPAYGWVPLGWGDASWPHWRCSTSCWRALNRPFAVNVAERPASPPTRFSNASVPGALSVVPGRVLETGKPVNANLVRTPAPLAGAALAPSEAPGRPSQRSTDRLQTDGGAVTRPPRATTPDRNGRLISASPARELSSGAATTRATAIPGQRVYGGVTDGRGAYTGLAPTPGPKLPLANDRTAPRSLLTGSVPAPPNLLVTRSPAAPGVSTLTPAGPPPPR
jgi:hypothetical protein